MATDCQRISTWFTISVLLLFHVSLALSSVSSQPEGKLRQGSVKGAFRSRRQECQDGSYTHEPENRTCCLCAAGQKLVKNCVANPGDRICEYCEPGTYSSHPNFQETCQPCTSCAQPNANLEVGERCTSARDTKCQCKKDHYCSSGTETCKLCHPCAECGVAGVKEACTATSNTVCKDKGEVGMIVGITVGILGVVAILLAVFLWRKRRRGKLETSSQTNGAVPDVEMQLIKEIPVGELQRFLPDIAEQLDWSDMEQLAMRSGIPQAFIDSCARDHPGNTQEQTLKLLKRWVEKEGKNAPRTLIENLNKHGKRGKAETIQDILSKDDSA